MEKSNNTQTVLFTEVMTSDQINKIGLLMRKFEKQDITYKELKNQLKGIGFNIVNSVTLNPSIFKLINNAEELIKRINSETMVYNDINSYILKDQKGENILFQNNKQVLEEMAKHNDAEAIKILNTIEDFQARRFPGYKKQYYKITDQKQVKKQILVFKAFGFADSAGKYPVYFNDIETGELLNSNLTAGVTLNQLLKNIQEKNDLIIEEDKEGNIKQVSVSFESIREYYKTIKEKNSKNLYDEIVKHFNFNIPDFESK